MSARKAKEAYGFDEDYLWEHVINGDVKAYFYVHEKMGLKYKGCRLTSRFYELSWPDLYLLGIEPGSNVEGGGTIELTSLDGELEKPLGIARHAIRFDSYDLDMLANPDRLVLDLDLGSNKEHNFEDSNTSFDWFEEDRKDDNELKKTQTTRSEYTTTLTKIVALLAYLYAKKEASCRIGKRVNANRLEAILNDEAQKLGMDRFGITSCRKKISECLKDYDIPDFETG